MNETTIRPPAAITLAKVAADLARSNCGELDGVEVESIGCFEESNSPQSLGPWCEVASDNMSAFSMVDAKGCENSVNGINLGEAALAQSKGGADHLF
ncbi:hypothetical protein Tco_0706852 [Tanacetum coccineum]|uniref:Uncharacterized protein n=1 Tax=Tanacetum coccineum TaxID=301880 RepID=A0ABQ4YA48_9ASTR